MKNKTIFIIAIPVLSVSVFFASLWYFSGRLLYPPWKTASLAEEPPEYWGENYGNLRLQKKIVFSEVAVESENGRLAGWYVPYYLNMGKSSALSKATVFFLHGAGADRRQGFRYLKFFLNRGYDVYLFDLSGHGESSFKTAGFSFGIREHKDAIAIFNHLKKKYASVTGMGTSTGASSLLIALDELDGIHAVIAENPFYSPDRFITEIPSITFVPKWYSRMVLQLVYFRGGFTGNRSAGEGVASQSRIPVLFIHSKKDRFIPYRQTLDLYNMYRGPKKLYITEGGGHTVIWDSEPELYENTVDSFLKELPAEIKI